MRPSCGNLETLSGTLSNRHAPSLCVKLGNIGESGRATIAQNSLTTIKHGTISKVTPNCLMRLIGLVRSKGWGCASIISSLKERSCRAIAGHV